MPYISPNPATDTHDYLNKSIIQNVIVTTDEGPSLKLALREDGSRGNIES